MAPALILANPRAGGGLAAELIPHMAKELQDKGYQVELFRSTGEGQICEQVRGLRGKKEALVVIGGDGTMREVVQGCPPRDLPVAFLPAGTTNVLAAEYRLPKEPRKTARMIEEGKTRLLDVGKLWDLAGQQEVRREAKRFLLFVGAGIDARIVSDAHRKRSGGTMGKFKYVGPVLKNWFGFKASPHWFRFEDGRREGPFAQIVVTNVRNFGGFWKLPDQIACDDGLLDCFGFRADGRMALLKHGIKGSFGRLRPGADLFHETAARLRIESSDALPYQIDGDPGGVVPVELEVEKQAFRIFVPAKGLD